MPSRIQEAGHRIVKGRRSIAMRLPEEVYEMFMDLVLTYGGTSATSAVIVKAIRCLHAIDPEFQRQREIAAAREDQKALRASPKPLQVAPTATPMRRAVQRAVQRVAPKAPSPIRRPLPR